MMERIDTKEVSSAAEHSWESRPPGEQRERLQMNSFMSLSPLPPPFVSGGNPPPKPCILLCPSERHGICRENNNGT